jgi:photosystem II stability/assembly factor-like uncharacterized protein
LNRATAARAGHWELLGTGLDSEPRQIVIDSSNPSTIYAVTSSGVLSKSGDGGHLWFSLGPAGATVVRVTIDPADPATLYAAADRVYRSVDAGASWSALGLILPVTVPPTGAIEIAVTRGSPSALYAGTFDFGILRSADSGASWEDRDSGLPGLDVYTVAVDPFGSGSVFAGGAGYANQRIMGRGQDGTWTELLRSQPQGNLEPSVSVAGDPSAPGSFLAGFGGCGIFCTGTVWKSGDSGRSWGQVLSTYAVASLAADPKHSGTYYVGTAAVDDEYIARGTIERSRDGGVTWSHLSYPADAEPPTIVIDPVRPENVYAATGGTGLFRSTDSGDAWAPVDIGATVSFFRALAIDSLTGRTLYASVVGGVYRSDDGGATWEPTGLKAEIGALAVDPRDPATVYAASYFEPGVFRSVDSGRHWMPMNTGLSVNEIHALAVDSSGKVYAATSAGVWDYEVRDRGTRLVPPRPERFP